MVTGTSTSAVAQIQTFTAMPGDLHSCRNVTRGVEHQLRTITSSTPRGTALASLHSTNPSSRPCPIGWPPPPRRLLSASTAPSHPNHTEGLLFPSPWQCTHPAVVTPATQERPPGRVTTCSHGPALRRSSRTNMALPRPPHSPTSPLLCLGHCGPCPLQAGLTAPHLNTQLRLFPWLLLRQTAPRPA